MNIVTTPAEAPDYAAIKSKQNAAWSSGDYARIGVTLQVVGEDLAEAADLPPDARVIDIAAGNGNATLAFARRWNRVTSTDYVDSLLARGQTRAEAEGLDIAFEIADAEALQFADNSFDAAVSTFGIMFAPDQANAAREMQRVCRTGGTIAMANWTPSGFIGQVFNTLGGHVAPPAGVKSPALWGTRDWIDEHFGAGAAEIFFTPKDFVFRYRSPEHFVDIFRTFYGPVHKAFLALGENGDGLERDLLDTIARFNTATDGTMRVPSEYAEIIIRRA